jgi:hypothetical protein
MSTNFTKTAKYEISRKSIQLEYLVTCELTDGREHRQTDRTKLTARLHSSFAKAPKINFQ